MGESKEKKLIKNTAIIAIGNICTKCISFLMLPLYTSMLTTIEYGIVDLISTYVTLLAVILTLQFEQGVFRFLVESRDDKNKQEELITTSVVTIIMVNVVFVVIILPLLLMVNYEYTVYLIVWAILSCFNALLLQLPRGLGKNAIYATASFISGSSNVLLNVLFIAIFRWGIVGMLYAHILAFTLSLTYIVFSLTLWKYLKIKSFSLGFLKQLSKYSFPLIPYTLCWWVIGASDRQIIKYFMGVSANGIYSIAYRFSSIFTLVTGIFQTAWTESAAENVFEEDHHEYYQKMVNKTIRFYSSGNIGIIACIPLIFRVLIKNDFILSYNYIPILMTSSLLSSVLALYGSIYFAYKKTKEIAWTTVASAIINILVNIVFIKYIGLYAAAISTFIAYGIALIIRHVDIQKITQITIDRKYLIVELTVYILVMISYYFGSLPIQIIVLMLLVPYCFYQNRDILILLMKKVKIPVFRR